MSDVPTQTMDPESSAFPACPSAVPYKNDTNPNYTYTSLPDDKSIRLLVLSANSDPDAALEAAFRVVHFDEDPEYDAISYTWEAPEFPERIRFGNEYVAITRNLASALRSFRDADIERVLWADAVCINQQDIAEKSSQVALMSEIYKKAEQVLIWLGDPSEQSKSAMEGYRLLSGWMGFSAGFPGLRSDSVFAPFVEKRIFSEIVLRGTDAFADSYPEYGVSPGDMLLSHDMNYIYENCWFTRLWTVQEVCLASAPIICCGQDRLSWQFFAACMLLFKGLRPSNGFTRNLPALLRAASIVEARCMYQIFDTLRASESTTSILSLEEPMGTTMTSSQLQSRLMPRIDYYNLCNILKGDDDHEEMPFAEAKARVSSLLRFGDVVEGLRSQNCSDDKDRIYALLSLRAIEADIDITPDYSLPVSQIYGDYAAKSLMKGYLEVLYDAGLWYREEFTGLLHIGPGYLPSWVPDFRKSSRRDRLPWLNSRKSFANSIRGELAISARGLSLSFSGLVLDNILGGTIATLPRMWAFGGGPTTYDKTRELVRDCLELCAVHGVQESFPSNSRFEEAFWSTLLMEGLGPTARAMLRGSASNSLLNELGQMYEKHCLAEDGEVTRRPGIVDLWLYHGEKLPEDISEEAKLALACYKCLRETMNAVVFFVTGSGRLGLAPPDISSGDKVVVMSGACHPLIVREVPLLSGYIFIGPCYVYGVSRNGVALDGEFETIELI
ncbi:hypothetical protein GRF29_19g2460645 [Pseudopithomyces chartarum]|uniref:Heterokaryon incompatibility domain-containing protein n=1 Tax=Pseudopithomyces chartarum TaxID=1892770 RepID=A0AAN6RLW1_9PLEO|nr:hypothetical protein GRF29_19g2460645 [Pseudopithomyces chartarum]